MASSEPQDMFNVYSQGPSYRDDTIREVVSHPVAKKKAKSNRPSPFRFMANFRQSSQNRETSPANSDTSETPTESSGRQLMHRSSIIMSSGSDKYMFDSETVMPQRCIETFERTISRNYHSPVVSPVTSPTTQLSLRRQQFARTSRMSSGSASDRTSTRSSDVPSDAEGTATSGSSSPSLVGTVQRRFKRDSIVQSGRDVSRALVVNGRYQNPWDTWAPMRFTNILKFGLSKDKSNVPAKEQLDIVLPMAKPNVDGLPPSDAVRVTWLGHSTVLVQMDGITVLTDPMFSDRASPSQVVGPKRYREPPLTIHELPSNLDAVVISHNHYDHLDLNSVTLLNARYGSDLRWFIPLGLAPWFETAGCENVIELDWWEENGLADKSEVSFVFTPAQHWSKRTLNDDNKSLWGSWVIIGPNHRFFFSGDTGYCSAFKEIGQMYGPFTVSAIPIGAFEPRWFMKYQHVNPEEAVKIHQDLRSNFSLAIHWGTFALANEYYLDPPVKLREALESQSVPADSFITFKHGESRLVRLNGKSTPEKGGRKKHLPNSN